MNTLFTLKKSLEEELNLILCFWKENTVDQLNGGFIGQIEYPDIKKPLSNKGIILNARILWTFSAASNLYKDKRYDDLCQRSFDYLNTNFKDKKYGGVFWELDYQGNVVNPRKQIYAQAFMIYALSEYYLYSKNEESKIWAIDIFNLIEKHALDYANKGYVEAFSQEWELISDMRLSEKDINAPKTMNTHLHIVEAYTTFFKIYPEKSVKEALEKLILLFLDTFYHQNGHFNLFFDQNWNLISNTYSYGHDIETAWLLIEAAKSIQNESLLQKVEHIAIDIANRFVEEAIDEEGGVMNEINNQTGHVDTDRHWWPQAEGIVGLYYTYQITKNTLYIDHAFAIWRFIQEHIKDHTYGEWFWRIDADGNYNPKDEKVGMWKCPYHNSRACIQLNL